MKRSCQSLICALLFILLTAVKMVSPAAASNLKAAVIPVLDRNDDYSELVNRMERSLTPKRDAAGTLQLPESPLEQIRSVLEKSREDPMADLPKASGLPEPASEEAEENPALEYGYEVRETFLRTQAEITDAAPPDNVSYEIIPLPFSETAPVNGILSSGFGYRIHPIQEDLRFHYGTDFAAQERTEIFSFADGVVLAAGEEEGYGNYVKINHGDGFETLYSHCSAILVSEGARVSKGDCIALVGSSGQATGPHLHFELMHNGVYLNPEFYLYA